jgi:large subunit ribosomal protein LP0
MSRGEGKKADRKKSYWTRLVSLLDEYTRVLVVTADNVGSKHMQQIRKAMRGKAVLLMGKNTMIRKAIRDHLEKTPALEGLLPYVKGNIGLVFTNGDLSDIRTKLTELKVQAAAKAGSIAPVDVVVPAGNTNMEPTKTSFFQALSIPTKINRGTIEIINDIHLLTVGNKVSLSQAALLQMLGIRPFQYGLKVTTVYDNGAVYPAAVLDLTDDDILKKFFSGVNNVAALSLQIGFPTVVSVPHSVMNGYKNLIAISVMTDYTFPGAEKIKQLLSDPAAFAAAQAAAAAAAAGSDAADGGSSSGANS